MKMSKFIMLVGLPGSGKTYITENYFSRARHISSDAIREEMWGDASDQRNGDKVFREMDKRTCSALEAGEDVVYDATNMNSRKRKAVVSMVKNVAPSAECICVLVMCSIKECKRRQNDRDCKVPEEVIDRMARSFQVPFYNEGWDHIKIYQNGPKQDIDKEHSRLMVTAHDNPHHTTESLGMHCTRALSAMRSILAESQEEPGDIGEHILCEVAYQHDLGKRKCKVFHDTKGNPTEIAHYYGHENLGAYLWLSGDKAGEWNEYCFLLIGLLIQLHMMPYAFPNKSKEELEAWCAKRGYTRSIAEWVWKVHLADGRAH